MGRLSLLAAGVIFLSSVSNLAQAEGYASAPGWKVKKNDMFCELRWNGDSEHDLILKSYKGTRYVEAHTLLIFSSTNWMMQEAMREGGARHRQQELEITLGGYPPEKVFGARKREATYGLFASGDRTLVEFKMVPEIVDVLSQTPDIKFSTTGATKNLSFTFALKDFEAAGARLLDCVQALN